MTAPLLRWISLFTCLTTFVLAPIALAADQRTWVWVIPNATTPARHVQMVVRLADPVPESGLAQFSAQIHSDLGFRGAQLELVVEDAKGQTVSEGMLPLDISAGSNSCRVSLDTSAMAFGTYEARFTIRHTQFLDEPAHSMTLRKVNADKLLEDLAAHQARIAELGTALQTAADAGRANPYLQLKANIVSDVLSQAQNNAGNQAWESLEAQLRYVRSRIDMIHAGLVFGDVLPELAGNVTLPPLQDARIEDGAFYANGMPVFLLGGALPAWDESLLARLNRYQLHAATITVGPESAGDTTQEAEFRAFLDATTNHNVAVAVQLAPDELPVSLLEAHPDIRMGGIVDIARPEALELWESFVAKIGPTLTGRPMVVGVSLVDNPRFRFDGEAVKAGFLEFLRANYPDRLTLNRSWRAHLASLDDIKLWSTDPYDTYQEHRPFQFDWQTYHQSLGNNYVNWSRALVQRHIPDMPLMATLNNTVFTKAETRNGVDREQLAAMLQVSGCSAESTLEDPVYAMSYPAESAYYTLLRSFEPSQPVFNLGYRIDPGLEANDDLAYAYVHSAVWEAIMSGMNGGTVPMDSLLFQHPYALEAYATASLDLNRLATIVHAFQKSPIDVGILFSYASKVFDDGDPHLLSAKNAYEGVSFGGYNVRFVSEDQCASGILDEIKILVLPDTPAMSDEAFQRIAAFVEKGGTVARTGTPSPYNERGYSRGDLIRNTGNTVLVRGLNLPTEYLHAMDAATVLGALPQIPRPVTNQGYPIEGLKSRYVEFEGEEYLYILNIRKEPVYCALATQTTRGRDLIHGRDIVFPTTIEPLTPMLLRLDPVHLEMTVSANSRESE